MKGGEKPPADGTGHDPRAVAESLREHEQRYREMFETNTAIKLVIDPESGLILDANQSAVAFYGYGREELLRKRIQEINTLPPEMVQAEMERARSEERLFFNFRHRLASGEVRDVEVYSGPLSFDGRTLLHSIIVDVTARRRLEHQLSRAQRLEATGKLAGGIAHDFNNILAIILGYVEIARRSLDIEHPARSAVEEIGSAAQRASNITSQLLSLARERVQSAEIVDLRALVRGMDGLFRQMAGEDVELITDIAPNLASVLVEAPRFEQVLMNLVLNAREAMPEGGSIQLQLTNVHVTEGTALPGVGAGDWVKVAVSDTGIGIPEEALSKVFEPFFTTKAAGGGTGLGLATSAILVEQSNGTFRVQSKLGVGTCFEVYLPAVKGHPQPSGIASAPTGERGEGTVLVVEDEPALRGILARMLLDAGYTVIAAANGAEALALVRDKHKRIDILVTDVIMPSMGGRPLVEALRELDAELPVLFISGYPADLNDHNLKAKNTELLRKPFAPNELLSRVHALAKKES